MTHDDMFWNWLIVIPEMMTGNSVKANFLNIIVFCIVLYSVSYKMLVQLYNLDLKKHFDFIVGMIEFLNFLTFELL